MNLINTILYMNSVSLSVSSSVEVLKPRSLLIKLSPRTRRPKNYSGPRVLTSYFYFYIRFRAATTVVDGGGIFGIWRVGEEIWVRFFWAKGLGGSWFLFFLWRGGGGGGGVLGVLIGGSELEWEMWRTGWGDRRGALCIGFTLVYCNHLFSYQEFGCQSEQAATNTPCRMDDMYTRNTFSL
jgi:hypothetical protein